MTTGLSNFFKHNLWANLRLLDVCAQLTDSQLDATVNGTYGTIRTTLQHMLTSEEGYVSSFTRHNPSTPSYPVPTPPLKTFTSFPGVEELRRRAELSGNALITIVQEHDLDELFLLDNGTYECPAIIVALQAYNHGVDHRSQINTILTQIGIEPPTLDSWGYNDELYGNTQP